MFLSPTSAHLHFPHRVRGPFSRSGVDTADWGPAARDACGHCGVDPSLCFSPSPPRRTRVTWLARSSSFPWGSDRADPESTVIPWRAHLPGLGPRVRASVTHRIAGGRTNPGASPDSVDSPPWLGITISLSLVKIRFPNPCWFPLRVFALKSRCRAQDHPEFLNAGVMGVAPHETRGEGGACVC